MHLSNLSRVKIGKSFEDLIDAAATRFGVGCQKIKNQGWQSGLKTAIRVPYDQLLMWKGRAVAIDAKTFDKNVVSFSDLVEHQLDALVYAWKFGLPAGYLVWHRPIDKVVFYGALMLADLNPKSSLNWEEGLCIGGMEDMDVRRLFTVQG